MISFRHDIDYKNTSGSFICFSTARLYEGTLLTEDVKEAKTFKTGAV